MIDPRSAKRSARSSFVSGRFKRLLGLDRSSRTVTALLPRYAAETCFLRCGAGSAVQPTGQGMWTFGPIGRPADHRDR